MATAHDRQPAQNSSPQPCRGCGATLLPAAKFCHACGEKTSAQQKDCPDCQNPNPTAAIFCHHCGHDFEGKRKKKTPEPGPSAVRLNYPLNFETTLFEQLKAFFFKDLRARIDEEHDVSKHSEYLERVYSTPFRDTLDYRLSQVAQGIQIQREEGGPDVLPQIDRRLAKAFDGLLDFFIVHYCRDLHGTRLPEAILKYENARSGKIDIAQMIYDFLDLKAENEVIFTDFVTMPVQKLQNACTAFLHADRRERIFFICDLSLGGSCKEGFGMTDRGIYWKAQLNSAHQVQFGGLKDLKFTKEYLTVNGHFFNVNPSFNLKIYKLLKKLRELSA